MKLNFNQLNKDGAKAAIVGYGEHCEVYANGTSNEVLASLVAAIHSLVEEMDSTAEGQVGIKALITLGLMHENA